jgi:hypothetical protein
MEARAALRGNRIETTVMVKFIVSALAVFLLGGAGGYLVRGLSAPASSTVNPAQQTVQTQQPIPYSTPIAVATPQQTLDPAGNVITF